MNDDLTLLREFARDNSEAAFASLVSRHIALVYSVALRQVRDPHLADEITQAVFIILARKADSLGDKIVLSGWLCRTARYAAANALTVQRRRQHREQEAFMQSQIDSGTGFQPVSEAEVETWNEISPLLDAAMEKLGQKDHDALVLRFFENKNFAEVAAALGASEDATKMRVGRALEKLRTIFARRGVSSTTEILAGTISINSVQAAPVGLAKTVSTVAIAKGATASTSTLTLIKGALKIMAWTKAKTAIVTAAVVALAVGTTTVTVREIRQHDQDSQWDLANADMRTLDKAPHIVRIIPTKFPGDSGWVGSNHRSLGIAEDIRGLIQAAYGGYYGRTVYLVPVPNGKYDFIANLPTGSPEALQGEIQRQFGLVGRLQTLETNVLFLKVKQSGAAGLMPTKTRNGSASAKNLNGEIILENVPAKSIAIASENELKIPVIDQTGLKGGYDIDLKWNNQDDPQHENFKQALNEQLGLELVPGTAPVEFLIVEKVQ